jgi:peptide/nickel transport system ATP-binding protein
MLRRTSGYLSAVDGVSFRLQAGDALEVSVQAQILNLLRELQRALGVSYLFITHNIGVVEYIADPGAGLDGGRHEEQGDCATVLGAPTRGYTRTLLAAVPRLAGT